MIGYYALRITGYYIPNLITALKACQSILERGRALEHESPDWLLLQDLRELSANKSSQTLSALIMKAYEFRSSPSSRGLLRDILGDTAASKRLWNGICFLGRLRATYTTFVKVAYELPAFTKVVVETIRKRQKPKPPSRTLTLAEAFEALGLAVDDDTVRKHVGSKYTIAEATKDFDSIQAQKPCTHAEVQMLLYLSENEELAKDVFQYVDVVNVVVSCVGSCSLHTGPFKQEDVMGGSMAVGLYRKHRVSQLRRWIGLHRPLTIWIKRLLFTS